MTAMTMPAGSHAPSRIKKLTSTALVVGMMLLYLGLMFSCGGSDDSYNDGSSVKPAQDAAGREYDRRRDRE